jgi:hypothetical protein
MVGKSITDQLANEICLSPSIFLSTMEKNMALESDFLKNLIYTIFSFEKNLISEMISSTP